uniref:Uncharacterized protein n=3 Tax=Setaria TaxID=4554 RepID=K3Y991_SETIT
MDQDRPAATAADPFYSRTVCVRRCAGSREILFRSRRLQPRGRRQANRQTRWRACSQPTRSAWPSIQPAAQPAKPIVSRHLKETAAKRKSPTGLTVLPRRARGRAVPGRGLIHWRLALLAGLVSKPVEPVVTYSTCRDVCRARHLASLLCFDSCLSAVYFSCSGGRKEAGKLMASNYVDTAAEEGRFHGHYHHHSTTPTGAAAASPKHMRRSWSSASSAHGHGHAPKCVCAPATHAGSFKCRLHRSSSHGHGHPASPPSPAATTSAAPPPAVPPSSSRTVAAQ